MTAKAISDMDRVLCNWASSAEKYGDTDTAAKIRDVALSATQIEGDALLARAADEVSLRRLYRKYEELVRDAKAIEKRLGLTIHDPLTSHLWLRVSACRSRLTQHFTLNATIALLENKRPPAGGPEVADGESD